MKLIKLLFAFCFMLALVGTVHAGVIANDKDDIDFSAFVPCADDGNGEFIEGTGRLHALFRETVDANGGVHFGFHFQPMGLKATGLTTGDRYHATGVTQGSTSVGSGGLPISDTYINRFHLVGDGGAVTYYVRETIHVTFNANGELTAIVDNTEITCD